MFTRIQARFFRSLRSIDQNLGPFQALVGPNASGKSTFLDVIGFLSDLMQSQGDVLGTVQARSLNLEDLIWMCKGNSFQLAVEANIPEHIKKRMAEDKKRFTKIRYELEIALDKESQEIGIHHETLWLVLATQEDAPARQPEFFPTSQEDIPIILPKSSRGYRVIIKKKLNGNDNYYPEGRETYKPSFKLGRGKSALANIPADSASFPVSTWFRDLLYKGVQTLILNSKVIKQPSPPGLGRRFQMDGSNLPWVIAELRKDKNRFDTWLEHVRTALEDIVDIETIERPEDKHRYLRVNYGSGASIPSWLVSDGTLRLLALTIPAYLSYRDETFLIEEPENGIHPRAIETIFQSLSSIYHSQVLIATHSPVAINMLNPNQILCFAKDRSGATNIISGDLHPVLRDWKQGEPDLGVLFASGILS
jgi:predicted ATPase